MDDCTGGGAGGFPWVLPPARHRARRPGRVRQCRTQNAAHPSTTDTDTNFHEPRGGRLRLTSTERAYQLPRTDESHVMTTHSAFLESTRRITQVLNHYSCGSGRLKLRCIDAIAYVARARYGTHTSSSNPISLHAITLRVRVRRTWWAICQDSIWWLTVLRFSTGCARGLRALLPCRSGGRLWVVSRR